MAASPRAKGNRTRRKAIDYYTSQGWLVDVVEKTGKWVIIKDLYSIFDLVAVKKNVVCFIQVKTNQPATRKEYISFAEKYGGDNLLVEGYTWYDSKGFVIHQFFSDGSVNVIDGRKK